MELANIYSSNRRRNLWLAGGFATLTVAGAFLFYATGIFTTHNRHEEVAARGATVMPFDLEQTMHVFQKLEDGGLQKVVVKEPSNELPRPKGRGFSQNNLSCS
jgi:hypothetical protein